MNAYARNLQLTLICLLVALAAFGLGYALDMIALDQALRMLGRTAAVVVIVSLLGFGISALTRRSQ